uniref:Uncharacterized protein n=1 Tax=Arundo donax TaxID=35708 RepID=A0A0A8YN49_ARUDO
MPTMHLGVLLLLQHCRDYVLCIYI